MFSIIIGASVLTNAGISTFSIPQFNFYVFNISIGKVWAFIIFQWICFSIQAILHHLVPDTPWEVTIQQGRQKFLVSKVIHKISDEPSSIFHMVFDESVLSYAPDAERKSAKSESARGLSERSRARKFTVGDSVVVNIKNKCDCTACKDHPPIWKVMRENGDNTYNLSWDNNEFRGGCLCWSYYHEE